VQHYLLAKETESEVHCLNRLASDAVRKRSAV